MSTIATITHYITNNLVKIQILSCHPKAIDSRHPTNYPSQPEMTFKVEHSYD